MHSYRVPHVSTTDDSSIRAPRHDNIHQFSTCNTPDNFHRSIPAHILCNILRNTLVYPAAVQHHQLNYIPATCKVLYDNPCLLHSLPSNTLSSILSSAHARNHKSMFMHRNSHSHHPKSKLNHHPTGYNHFNLDLLSNNEVYSHQLIMGRPC